MRITRALEGPAIAGPGAGAEARVARAMQGAAIPILETPPERTWIGVDPSALQGGTDVDGSAEGQTEGPILLTP